MTAHIQAAIAALTKIKTATNRSPTNLSGEVFLLASQGLAALQAALVPDSFQLVPIGIVATYNRGGTGERNGIEPIGKAHCSLAEELEAGTLVYAAPVQQAAPSGWDEASERTAFEAWVRKAYPAAPLDHHPTERNRYDGVLASWTWNAWKARAAAPAKPAGRRRASRPAGLSDAVMRAAGALLAEHEAACATEPMFALLEMAEDDEEVLVSAVLLADLFAAVRDVSPAGLSEQDKLDAATRLAYCVQHGFPQHLSTGWWGRLPNGNLVKGAGPIEAIDAAILAAKEAP